jgi:RNA polymerase sigma-70 factor (ECF subfamily)
MADDDWLTAQFEASRPRLRAVAYRMLGSATEAEDAAQEAWLRLGRTDRAHVANMGGWLTTVVARVCLDRLRSRRARREEYVGTSPGEGNLAPGAQPDPADEAALGESVGAAMLVVLDLLAPAERVAFVLHDVFAVPFEEIAGILGARPARPANWPAGPGDGCRAPLSAAGSTPPASEPSSTPSCGRPASATSSRCSGCSTPVSCSGLTRRPCAWGRCGRRGARRRWRARCRAAPRRRGWPSWAGWRGWYGRRAGGPGRGRVPGGRRQDRRH